MTRTLVPFGFQLAVQVEMEDLTVGGLCMGLGMETTSHRLPPPTQRRPVHTMKRVLIPIPGEQVVQSKPFFGAWMVLVQCKKGGLRLSSHKEEIHPPGPGGRNRNRLPVHTIRRVLALIPCIQEMQSKVSFGAWVVHVQCERWVWGCIAIPR